MYMKYRSCWWGQFGHAGEKDSPLPSIHRNEKKPDKPADCPGCLLAGIIAAVMISALLLAFWGGPSTYYRCSACSAAFCSPAWHHGLPGQFNTTKCRYCGGRLRECSKEESGWRDDVRCDDGQYWK